MSTTPSFDSLMAQARAALVELDQAIEVDETERAVIDTRLAERRAMRRQIATIVGERPKPRQKKPATAAASSSGVFECGCGRSFPTAQALATHRTRTHNGVEPAGPVPPPAVHDTEHDDEHDDVSPVPAGSSQLEVAVRRLWQMHGREPVDRRVQLIADATGKHPVVIRETCRQLGLIAA